MRSDRGVRPCERSREAGEGLWPDGSRSICPQDYNPSVCAVAQPAPFTQGGLLCSRRGGFHIRPRRFAAAQDCTRRRGRRPLRPTTKPPLCKGGLLGSRRGGFHIRPWRFTAAQDPAQFPPSPQSHTSLKIFGAKSTTFFFAVQERFLQKVLYFVRECGTIFLIYKIHRTFKKL